MSVGTFFLARAAKLSPRLDRARRTRGLRIAMPDGIRLDTELYRPRREGQYPTLLIRVPYGLGGFSTAAEAYAERGYNVVIQACRGTGKSEGEFDPLSTRARGWPRHPRLDQGAALVRWPPRHHRPELSRLCAMGHLRRAAEAVRPCR